MSHFVRRTNSCADGQRGPRSMWWGHEGRGRLQKGAEGDGEGREQAAALPEPSSQTEERGAGWWCRVERHRWSSRPTNQRSKKATAGHQRRREREQRELAAVAAGPAEEVACSEVADDEDTRAAATQRDNSEEEARARQVETYPFCASIFAPFSNALNQFESENRRFARRFAVASPSLRRRFAVASPSIRSPRRRSVGAGGGAGGDTGNIAGGGADGCDARARAAATPVTQVTQVPKDTKHNVAPAGAVVGGAFLAFLVMSGLSVSFVACCSLVVGFCGFVASCLLRCMACLFFVLA